MDKAYDHKSTEDNIYQSWEEGGSMRANEKSDKKPFVISLPPPNVTGQLHLGHAAMLAIEDIMIRYQKMNGREVLWVPGTDHAAIATENVVLKHLGMQNREEMSREGFLGECRKFAQEKHDRIVHQIKKMGAWLDWSREAYTFDDERNHAVNHIFKMLYEDGLIVRGHRMINWSVGAQSVLSDDEVEYREVEGAMYHYRYFLADGSGDSLEVATTRPETMFGDTALAMNPKDKRLKKYEGKKVCIPFSGKEIPIIADEHVDPEFGTGVVKVTPAHDPNDFEIGERHDLPKIQVIGFDGTMMSKDEVPKEFQGLTREHCRKELIKESEWFVKKASHIHNIGFCYRSETVVEPMISPQWFVSVEKEFTDTFTGKKTTLKKLTQEAVRGGDVKIIPERFEKTYFQWIDNLRDWCISRQIWWGHRIPVWYDKDEKIHLADEQKILFVRHGESEANRDGLIQGCTLDTPLTEKGLSQAKELAKKLKKEKISKILCSKLLRASQTAEILGKELGVEVETWDELREMDSGKLVGQKGEACDERKIQHDMYTQKTGENFADIQIRAEQVWNKLGQEKTEGKILVVGHSAFLAALMATRKGLQTQEQWENFVDWWHMPNCETKEVSLFIPPKGSHLRQDEDTLDTWFSSALWPFSTLGWPDKNASDLQNFYPTDVLETGWDILFFWVARMIMFGRYATGASPFHTVYLHGMVTDEHGKKMSKSKGNGIDPLDMVEEFGADAVRLSLVIGTAPGNPIPVGKAKISGYRNFVNKLWNAGRFVQMQIGNDSKTSPEPKSLADKWILSRLARVTEENATYLQKYEISSAGDKIYHFVWGEFCDWYIEASKVEPNPAFLKYVFLEILKLTHPLCPFVTEALWQELAEGDIVDQDFPKIDFGDKDAENLFSWIQQTIFNIRSLRADNKISPHKKIQTFISGTQTNDLIEAFKYIQFLGGTVAKPEKKESDVLVSFKEGLEIFIEVPIDEGRIKKEKAALEGQIKALESRLNNKGYTDKAPAALVEQTKKELKEAKEKLKKLS